MQQTRMRWLIGGGLALSGFLVALGCGSGGSVTNDRNTLALNDVTSIVFPGDLTKVTEVETTPRETFGKSFDAVTLGYGNLDANEISHMNQGINVFQADRVDPNDGAGPFFNQRNCLGCHQETSAEAGTIATPVSRALTKDAFLVFCNANLLDFAFDELRPFGGPILHKRSIPGYPVKSEPDLPGAPVVRSIGMRAAPAYIGRGLMESVYDEDILANKDNAINGLISDDAGTPISVNENRNSERLQIASGSSVVRLSRFGLRAGGPTLIQFALGNAPGGLSSPFSPGLNTPSPQGDTHPSHDLTTEELRNCRTLVRMCAPPTRVAIVPGSSEDRGRTLFGALNYDDLNNVASAAAMADPIARRGMLPVAQRNMADQTAPGRLNCVGCHMPIQITGISPADSQGGVGGKHLTNKRAFLFSDLLIHAMGHGLATTRLKPTSGTYGSIRGTTDGNDPLSLQNFATDANVPLPGFTQLLPQQSTQEVTLKKLGLDQYGINPRHFPNEDGKFILPEDATLIDQGHATPFTWRTATLMGVSLTGPPYLHDARVLQGQSVNSALRQAILFHAADAAHALTPPSSEGDLDPASEAFLSIRNFLRLTASQQQDVINYLRTL